MADGATGADTLKRFRFILPEKRFEGIDSLLLLGGFPNLRVLLNDREVYSTYSYHAKNGNASVSELQPHLIRLPDTLSSGENRIEIQIQGRERHNIALDQVWYGPYDELANAYKWRYYLKWVSLHALIVVYLLSAISALAFWWSDRSYKSPAWFAGFCGFGAVAMAMGMATESPPVSWPLYSHVAIFLAGITCLFLVQFVLEKTGRRDSRTDRFLTGMAAFFFVMGFVMYRDEIRFPYALLIDISCLVMGLWLMAALVLALRKRADTLNLVLLAGIAVSLLLGLQSVAAGWWTGFYTSSYSVQFAPLPITITMGWVVIRRYARMKLRADALNRRLTRRVALREEQLRHAFASINQLHKEEAIRLERERFMRDMHDGLGAQLICSIRMADRGRISPPEMKEILQECLDELRFSIESLKPTADDFLAVMGNYRYRLQPRLQATGITLRWQVQAAPHQSLNPTQILHVLRIVNEAVTNAMKHSGGDTLIIQGEQKQGQYLLSIADNGHGFDAQHITAGQGLESMRHRARQLQAGLHINAASQGCTVTLVLDARTASLDMPRPETGRLA